MTGNNLINKNMNNISMNFTYPKVIGEILSLLERGRLTGDALEVQLYEYSMIEIGYSLNELIEEGFANSFNIDYDIVYLLTEDGINLLHECMYYADPVSA